MSDIRNVLLISVDCLRADRFREGVESGLVPTFASLDDSGTTFESTFAVANTTDPSLTSFMTATYPFEHGVVENGWGLDETHPVGAERFRESGRDTFGVVSVDHLNHKHSKLGRGFDRYFDSASYDTLYPILSRIFDTKAFNTVFGAVKNIGTERYNVKNLLRDLGLIQLHCRTGRSVTDDAVEGLDATEPPFFGWVHYFDMHEPRNAPRELLGDYDEYTAAMMHVDDLVGELLSELEARGLREETLVVLTGDHGEALGDHGYTGHGRTLYDEEIHVPLVFAHDSLAAETVPTQVRTIDIMPTLLSLSGAEPLGAAGESVFDDDGPVTADRPVFAMAYPEFADAVAVRKDGWKLVRDREADEETMYDLESDPDEETDRSEAATDRKAALGVDLDEWLASFGETEHQSVDADTQEMLADLGYVE